MTTRISYGARNLNCNCQVVLVYKAEYGDDLYDTEINQCLLHEAAPDLLAACEFALGELSDMTTDEFSKGGDKAVREKLEAAIAKARGETST